MTLIRMITALSFSLFVAACGSEQSDFAKIASGLSKEVLGVGGKSAPEGGAPAAAPKIPSRDDLKRLGENVHFFSAQSVGFLAFAPQSFVNGENQVFETPDNKTIVMRDGIIVATRGLAGDLMSQGLSVSEAEITSGPFPLKYERRQSLIDLGGQIRKDIYRCEVTEVGPAEVNVLGDMESATQIEETCISSFRAFKNRYWVDPDSGDVLQSQQSVHPVSGFMIVQKIAE